MSLVLEHWLLLFRQYIVAFFESKSMPTLSRSDISLYHCKLMFAILLNVLLFFVQMCICLCYLHYGHKLYM